MSAVRLTLPCLALLTVGCAAHRAEEEEVLAAVHQFFDAMTARDVAASTAVLEPQGRFFSVEEVAGSVRVRSFTNADYLEALPARSFAAEERIFEPEVRIDGRIAVVFTPYDFLRDGRFSHRGTNAINLIKTEDGWKITGGVYTMERQALPAAEVAHPDR